MADRDYFRLEVNAPIFKELQNLYYSPEDNWWKKVLRDKDLYVNVRKDNRIDVYYKGAGVIRELQYDDKTSKLTCKIHYKYLGKESKDYKEIEGSARISKEIVDKIGFIKKNIDELNYKKNNFKQRGKNKGDRKTPPPEGGSEKELQWTYYIEGKYIDTEYAYNYDDKWDENGNLIKIRIDFITITNDGLIEFVELKRISDNRLLTKEYKEKKEKCSKNGLPEICDQMGKYTTFIQEHEERIVTYYKKVQTIMRNIGVNNPLVKVAIKGVAPKARLLFAPYLDGKEKHPKRMERVQRIAELLKDNAITSNIDELLEMIKD